MVQSRRRSQPQKIERPWRQWTPAGDHGILPNDQDRKKVKSLKQSSNKRLLTPRRLKLCTRSTGKRRTKADESEEAAQAFVSQGNNILLRIARVATGASVRWNRNVRTHVGQEDETGYADERKEDEVKYQSRLFACARCGIEQETKEKQLKINVGFRAIHCRRCGETRKGT